MARSRTTRIVRYGPYRRRSDRRLVHVERELLVLQDNVPIPVPAQLPVATLEQLDLVPPTPVQAMPSDDEGPSMSPTSPGYDVSDDEVAPDNTVPTTAPVATATEPAANDDGDDNN